MIAPDGRGPSQAGELQRAASGYVLRPVASLDELARTLDVIGAQMIPRLTRHDRRFGELARRFPDDRPLMLVAEDQGRIVGGALGFRKVRHGASGVTLRMIGLEPSARGQGLGRRLMQRLELAAGLLDAPAINLGGASAASKRFYERMGYSGRGSMMSKDLPGSGSSGDARRLEQEAACRPNF